MDKNLEKLLLDDLLVVCKKCETIGYSPSYFRQMIVNDGVLETCHRLIQKNDIAGYASGFERLWEEHKLQWSMEYIVLKPQYRELFTEEELRICKKRLIDLEFDFTKNYDE